MKPTAEQLKAGLKMLMVVAETVREAGEVPSGTIYAALIGKVDMAGYESMIRTLKNAGLIEEKFHMLRWIGPEIGAAA